jgi:hypothetical protein
MHIMATKTVPAAPKGADSTLTTFADGAALLDALREGLPLIVDLQRQVRALPPFRFEDRDDDNIVHDRLAAAQVVLGALDRIPRVALAAAIADLMMLNEDVEEIDGAWIGRLTSELQDMLSAGAAA